MSRKKKITNKPYKFNNKWWLPCKNCGNPVEIKDTNLIGITCWRCLQNLSMKKMPEDTKNNLFKGAVYAPKTQKRHRTTIVEKEARKAAEIAKLAKIYKEKQVSKTQH